MTRSKRKGREKTETEISFRIEYKSPTGSFHWDIIHARNELEMIDLFNNEFYTDKSAITKTEIIK